jgi:hypothetical protein
MKSTFTILVAASVALVAAASAPAQCRLESFPYGRGAVHQGRAIVSDMNHAPPFYVHFLAKTQEGWRTEQTSPLGDFHIFFDGPVAIEGDRAIVGAPESNDIQGEVLIFDRIGARWVPTRLVSPTPTPNYSDFFGSSVDISGDVAVIGASHEIFGKGDGLARVHVFEFDGVAWHEVTQLMTYGDSVDVEGDTIAVGDDRSFPGRAQIFRRVAGIWTWVAQLEVLPPPPGPILGASVALHGDEVAVGASRRFQTEAPGFVQIFRDGPNGWQPTQRIVPRQGYPDDEFGASLAWSGSTLLVAATSRFGGRGAVHRFDHDGTQFVETAAFRPEAATSSFGYRVALDGEDAFIGGHPHLFLYRLGFAERRSFCPATANSSGVAGTLAIEGCDSCSGRELTLDVHSLPPSVLAVPFFGTEVAPVPFGDGFRCVGGRLSRFPSEVASAAGDLAHEVDFDAPAASRLAPGTTWSFQVLYRDPGSAGARINLTNAVAVGITP